MNPNDLRRRAAELLSQAEALLAGVPEGEEPPADLSQRHDDLAAQAEALIDRAEQLEAMESRRAALAARAAAGPGAGGGAAHDARNTRGGRHAYSAARALSFAASDRTPDGLEGEVHSDLARSRTVATKGVLVDMTAAEVEYRAHSAAGAIGQVVVGPIWQALMAQLVLSQAGMQTLVSSSPFKLPLATAGNTYWVSNAAPTEADRSIGSAAFSAHTLAGSTVAGRQDLVQSSVPLTNYLYSQLLADLAVGLQAGCLHGSGAAGQPKGAFAYVAGDGVDVRPGATNGKALTYDDVLAMTGAVAKANAGEGAFVTNPAVFSKLEGTVKVTGQASFVASADSMTIADRRALTTSSVRADLTKGSGTGLSAIIYGDWTKALLAMFSGMDMLVNPYRADGGVQVSGFVDVDFGLVRPAAFSIATDVVYS
ncbi:MAG: hypothetical protein BGO49_08520 [Planctomycetales bacterium 71-10]|nr:MAG: hypothetical protein BGO49_08520 [Planctomycetales bacterium 71-10]